MLLPNVTTAGCGYPPAKGRMAPLMRCEDAAELAYAKRIAPEDVRWFSRYAQEVEQKATDVAIRGG